MLYDKIKCLAHEKKVTIAEVERQTSLANGVLSKWNDVSPNSDSLYKVAKFFGITMDELMDEKSRVKEENT